MVDDETQTLEEGKRDPEISMKVMIHLFLRKSCLDCISLEQKSCQVYSSVLYCMRGESGKGDIMVADIEELEEMDASELHARRL